VEVRVLGLGPVENYLGALRTNSPASEIPRISNLLEIHDGFSCALAQWLLDKSFGQYPTVRRLHN
jgi:hypothetical protein